MWKTARTTEVIINLKENSEALLNQGKSLSMFGSSYAPPVSKPIYLSWYNLSYKHYDKASEKTFAFSLKTHISSQ